MFPFSSIALVPWFAVVPLLVRPTEHQNEDDGEELASPHSTVKQLSLDDEPKIDMVLAR